MYHISESQNLKRLESDYTDVEWMWSSICGSCRQKFAFRGIMPKAHRYNGVYHVSWAGDAIRICSWIVCRQQAKLFFRYHRLLACISKNSVTHVRSTIAHRKFIHVKPTKLMNGAEWYRIDPSLALNDLKGSGRNENGNSAHFSLALCRSPWAFSFCKRQGTNGIRHAGSGSHTCYPATIVKSPNMSSYCRRESLVCRHRMVAFECVHHWANARMPFSLLPIAHQVIQSYVRVKINLAIQ